VRVDVMRHGVAPRDSSCAGRGGPEANCEIVREVRGVLLPIVAEVRGVRFARSESSAPAQTIESLARARVRRL
jgi:hypothetical protein